MKNFHVTRVLFAGALLAATMLPAAASAHADDGLARTSVGDTINVEWNAVLLQAIRDTKPGPPMTARAIAVVHTCIYDAWAAYDAKASGTQFGGDLRQPAGARTAANKRQAISYAAYMALSDLYPTQRAAFKAKLAALGYDTSAASLNARGTSTPAGVANTACGAVLAFRHADGSNQLGNMPGSSGAPYSDYTGYQPVNSPTQLADPSRWQPLAVPNAQGVVSTQKFVAPHWKNVTPFALTSATQFLPAPPAAVGSSRYLQQAQALLDISATLTDRQKVIAEYWADGPNSELPPGHWTMFATFVSRRDGHTMDQDSKLFFALGNSLMDAGIACWTTKVVYDYARPVTTIRYLFGGQSVRAWNGPGQNGVLVDGADWKPYQPLTFPTPPFAEYSSGHSTFSRAAAVILRNFTGSDKFGYSATIPAGSSNVEPGLVPAQDVTLAWKTFREAADEAGMSRRYGGIHFEDGDLVARAMGAKVGEQVWRKAQQLFGDNSDPR
ncbi:MAG: hypothetical protein RJB26_102 [Pseudomonadota bacterium]